MSFKWTPAEDVILEREWAVGTPGAEISKMLPGRTESGVNSRAHKRGMPRRVNGRKPRKVRLWSKEDNDTLLALYADGVRISEIARTIDRSPTAVDWRLMVLGAKRAEYRMPPAEQKPRVKRPCLRCGHKFSSEGKHNRVCNRCKTGSVWRSGGDFEARI